MPFRSICWTPKLQRHRWEVSSKRYGHVVGVVGHPLCCVKKKKKKCLKIFFVSIHSSLRTYGLSGSRLHLSLPHAALLCAPGRAKCPETHGQAGPWIARWLPIFYLFFFSFFKEKNGTREKKLERLCDCARQTPAFAACDHLWLRKASWRGVRWWS
jgi:hypothetical protein